MSKNKYKFDKKPLFRKIGKTRILDSYDNNKHNYRWIRGKKKIKDEYFDIEANDGTYHIMSDKKMKRGFGNEGKDGYDFTPLYKFLQSKAGQYWNDVYSEACARIPFEYRDNIFYLVYDPNKYLFDASGNIRLVQSYVFNELDSLDPIVKISAAYYGEQYWHKMFVDESGILRFVDKSASLEPREYTLMTTRTLDGIVVEDVKIKESDSELNAKKQNDKNHFYKKMIKK